MKRLSVVLSVVVLLALACGNSTPRKPLALYPSPTVLPTQTPYVVILTTTTVQKSPTPDKKQGQISTQTPIPACFVVTASEAVYLRPSPALDNYPIAPVPNGARLADLGGRVGNWYYVAYGELQGWVNSAYLSYIASGNIDGLRELAAEYLACKN